MTDLPISPFSIEFIPGNPLPEDATSYVVRPADAALCESLAAGDYCYVLESPLTGKSSLALRTRRRLEEAGVRAVLLNLNRISAEVSDTDIWYCAVLQAMGQALGLEASFLAYWDTHPDFRPAQRLFGALLHVGLEAAETPLVVLVDQFKRE